MARGDQIYVMRPLINMDGIYQHHGIDCGDGTVIHYYKGGEVATIARTSHATFALGNPVFIKSYTVSYVPEVVIVRAESRLGEQQYSLLTNNCEHFANWCKIGRSESQQLLDYGIGLGTMNPLNSRQVLDAATSEGDPLKTAELFATALKSNIAARSQLQAQANQIQQEIDTWQRVAQAALNRNREDLARAALERKVKYKRQQKQIQEQMQQLDAMQQTLMLNAQKLQQQITLNPDYTIHFSPS